jgi:long-chain acyl-CoA synthetase
MQSNGWERWPEDIVRDVAVEQVAGRELRAWRTRRRTMVDSILTAAERFPDKEMVRDPEGELTFREFVDDACTLAANLQRDADLRPGERVALLLSNSARFAVAVTGAQMAGGVVVPLNTKMRPPELEFELKDSQPKVALVDDEWWGTLEPIRASIDVPFVYASGATRSGARRLDSLLVRAGADFSPVELGEHHPALICYTSGTTGTPKGAVSTHYNCVNNFRSFAAVTGLRDSDRTLVVVPMFHVTGLLAQVYLLFDVGGSCVVMPRYDVTTALETIARERITHVVAPPTIYITMMEHPDRGRYDVDSVRMCISGSAPISPDTVYALREWLPRAKFQNAYGLTESSSIATAAPFEEAIRKVHTIGLPVPVTACRTVDPVDGRECEVGEAGELCIYGPQVVPGYRGRPEATAAAIRDGWLYTGDVASIDDEGYVQILDRIKDMINRGGEKVFCVEVEAVLFEHPQVLEAAVVGVPDRVYGEAVKAVLAPKPEQEIDPDEIRAFVSQRLAKYKVPKYVELVEALPRNANGKVMKSELREAVEAGAQRPAT